MDPQQEANFHSNVVFMVGYYEGTLKVALDEIKKNDSEYIMNRVIPLLENTLKVCNEVWQNRYEKHYSEITKRNYD